MRTGFVYKLICPLSGEVRYVGKTVQKLNKRLYKHQYEIHRNPSNKNSWLIGLEKLGLLFEVNIELVEECGLDIINDREIFWIKFFKDSGCKLTNMTEGGDVGSLGHKHSQDAIEKIRKRAKEPRSKMSEEGRKNISKSLIGNTRHKGYKQSEKTKNKISESKKGVLSWNATSVLQLNKEGNAIKEWVSATAAAKELKLNQSNIWMVINGKRKTCGGYFWKLK